MKKSYSKFLLQKVTEDYNTIASKFSSTRSFLSPDIIAFKQHVSEGDKVLDLGCGNGRLVELFTDLKVDYTGTDVSFGLLEEARKKYPELNFILLNDPLKLPFSDNCFDKVFNLAVLHHIPGKENQLTYLQEIYRVLKTKGKLILTVWYLWANPKARALIVKNNMMKFFGGKTDWNDLFYPFINKEKVTARYLHAFKTGELIKLLENAGFTIDSCDTVQRGRNKEFQNIQIIARK